MKARRKKRQQFIQFPHKPSIEDLDRLHRYLDNIYYDSGSGGSLGSPIKLLQEVKRRDYYRNVGLRRITNYLRSQNAYTLYRPARSKFPTPPVYVDGPNRQLELDIVDVSKDEDVNDEVRYLLTAIDSFSKYAYAVPLKKKDAGSVNLAVAHILDQHKTQTCGSDRGSEFRQRAFQRMLKDRGIRHFFAGGSGKMAILERWHRTLRSRIARFQYKRNNYRYIDDLQRFVKAYNSTYHRSIGMAPRDVNEFNAPVVYANLYGKLKSPQIKDYRFKLNATVRISGQTHPFRREFFERWSQEVFTVVKRSRQRGINMYRLRGCTGETLDGSFYEAEMTRVDESDANKLYKVKEILGRKREDGVEKVKVWFIGLPRKCAQWLPANQVKNIR